MKFGITERGDAGINLSWQNHMGEIDAAVLITKSITNDFIDAALRYKNKCIVHATCTGYGSTILEPYVCPYEHQLNQAQKLVDKGFPKSQIVIRIDPIIPTEKGIKLAATVCAAACLMGFKRFRISVMDMYPHVVKRFVENNVPSPYEVTLPNGEKQTMFSANPEQFAAVDNMVKALQQKFPDIRIECCAEPALHNPIHCGCISMPLAIIVHSPFSGECTIFLFMCYRIKILAFCLIICFTMCKKMFTCILPLRCFYAKH